MKTIICTCDCGSKEFNVYINKVESIGLANCVKCNKNYFILDSGEYWFDNIQEKYPSKIKCTKCKSDSFGLILTYEYRENYPKDIREVLVEGLCKTCNNKKNLMNVDIDYSPTDHLYNTPLIFCKNPKIKYNLIQFSCCWLDEDLLRFMEFLKKELKLKVYGQIHYDIGNNKCELRTSEVNLEEIKKSIYKEGCRYFMFYVSFNPLTFPKEGYFNWKKEEAVEVTYRMNNIMLSINISTNFIEDDKIKEKSEQFKQIIPKIENYLKSNYIGVRGKNCYDNPEARKRLGW